MTVHLAPKLPAEERSYRHDWVKFLGEDTLASQVTTANGATIDDSNIDGTAVEFVVSAGSLGTIAIITQTITTAAGLTESETFLQPISVDEPVSLAEAKAQTRMVEDDSQDDFLVTLLAPARAYVERVSRCLFVAGTRTETFRGWGDYLEIWRRPIASIQTVTYSTSDDPADDIEYKGFNADFNSFPLRIYPAFGGTDFPTLVAGQVVTVAYTTGALATTSEEYLIGKRAMLLLICHWFENRETAIIGQASAEVDFAVTELLNTIRPLSAY